MNNKCESSLLTDLKDDISSYWKISFWVMFVMVAGVAITCGMLFCGEWISTYFYNHSESTTNNKQIEQKINELEQRILVLEETK